MPITPQEFVSKWKRVTAVFAAYGWPGDLSDEERLLSMNLERANK